MSLLFFHAAIYILFLIDPVIPVIVNVKIRLSPAVEAEGTKKVDVSLSHRCLLRYIYRVAQLVFSPF